MRKNLPKNAHAVVAGLTNVDPNAYDGWNGNCPGCDVDAQMFGLLCSGGGIQTDLFHNREATSEALIRATRKAWKQMKAGDLFILYISGHGGQIPDTDGDEEDGLDETLCLWDGQLSDDILRKLWKEAPAGIRILFISDTCNSGTNFRARSISGSMPRSFRASLIHFGGSGDGESSYGDDSGGVFTQALLNTFDGKLSYKEWFDAAAAIMPRNQVPHYEEYGATTFRDLPAMKLQPKEDQE